MKRILHIFAKDVRLFYPEILISLLVTFTFTRLYPHEWGAPGVGVRGLAWLPELMTALVPVSWWLLIARVVHAESLVGERQFWTTRPYRWPSLLAAKALFIVAFVHLPFFLAQCVLLREAGFHPLAYLPGLLFNLALTTGILVLPLMALAAITSSFARMSLALLILLIYGAAMGYGSTFLPTSDTSDSYGDQLSFVVLVCLLVAIIVVQYATRRTLLSRLLLGALALTIGLLGLFGSDDLGMALTYPAVSAAQHPALNLAFMPEVARPSRTPPDVEDEREVELSIPIQISGIQPETAIKTDNVRVKISGPQGERWQSHWQSLYLTWLPGQSSAFVTLKINRAFFERVKKEPVSVEMTLALTELNAGKTTRMTLPEGPFSIPGGSICARTGTWTNELSCRSPLRQPPLMLVGTRFSSGDCSESSPANDGDSGLAWTGTLDTDPADFGITSVWTSSFNFTALPMSKPSERQVLCPGSPLAFAPYIVADRRQQKVTGPAMHLEDLVTRLNM